MTTQIVETNVKNLKINKLTQAQYNDAVQSGVIGENELSIITDAMDGPVEVMPTASAEYLGSIVQYAGVTDQNYTNGYFYKCVASGASYAWQRLDVQPQGDSLPSQTGHAGEFLVTDGTNASWSTTISSNGVKTIANIVSGFGTYPVLDLKLGSTTKGVIGASTSGVGLTFMTALNSLAGCDISVGNLLTYGSANPHYIGKDGQYNSWDRAYVKNIYNGLGGSGIAVPANGGTMVVADYTGASQGDVLTLDSNGNAVWQAGGSGGGVPTLTWYTISTAGTTLTIADTSSAQLVKVYKNGLLLQPTEDYTISGTTLTTVSAMVVGDKITTEVF